VNWEHTERAVWLAREGETGQQATLTAGLVLEIGYDVLRVAAEGVAQAPEGPQVDREIILAAPGSTEIGRGWRVAVARLPVNALPAEPGDIGTPWEAWLDAGATGPALTLRPRRPGDRFRPHGMGEHNTKINEFMINAKIPRAARAGWPLLVGEQGIAWVCGLRVDARAAVTPTTLEVWQVRVER
jgi:tRNA(Ile)-lysidine synthetase-like protein